MSKQNSATALQGLFLAIVTNFLLVLLLGLSVVSYYYEIIALEVWIVRLSPMMLAIECIRASSNKHSSVIVDLLLSVAVTFSLGLFWLGYILKEYQEVQASLPFELVSICISVDAFAGIVIAVRKGNLAA